MACNKTKFVGRDVVMQYAIGCPEDFPAPEDWKVFGSMRTKEMTLEWETTDATADDSVGALRENLATFQTMSVSGDGVVKAAGAGAANLRELTKHVAKPDATGGQPFAWIRMTFPDLTFTTFMILTNMSRSAPHDDVVTYSFEASASASDFGLLVEDTPNPDAVAITAVNVTPSTLSLEEDAQQQLAATVTPVGAPQGRIWSSSDTDVATVHPATGLVTAISEGTATVTATSTVDGSKAGSCAVTVTA